MADQEKPVQVVTVGDPVRVVDEQYGEHVGLVTAVHGAFSETFTPCINVAYISSDGSKRDPYGQQVERLSSLQHYSQGPDRMPKPGRYWINL